MITMPTVLVLGAGASAPFGFPCGGGLRSQIYQIFAQKQSPEVQQMLLADFTFEKISQFRHALSRSGSMVDEFLEYRTDFMDVGKASIASVLLQDEGEASLFNVNVPNNWYELLFRCLTLESSFESFGKNKLSIITFNYDRSIEQYLFITLKNRYNRTEQECAKKLEEIPIIHVHGTLGRLPWQQFWGPIVNYGGDINFQKIRDASKTIKVIHEDISDDPEFNQAYELMTAATRIYFLGFGYHPINLKRLRIKKLIRKDMSGTAYHLPIYLRNNATSIKTRAGHPVIQLMHSPQSENIDVFTYLNYHVSLI